MELRVKKIDIETIRDLVSQSYGLPAESIQLLEFPIINTDWTLSAFDENHNKICTVKIHQLL